MAGKKKAQVIDIPVPNVDLGKVFDSTNKVFADLEEFVESIQKQLPKTPVDVKEKVVYHSLDNFKRLYTWIKEHKLEILFGGTLALVANAAKKTWKGGD